MPCHVPATSVRSRPRRPSKSSRPPSIVATLDLTKPGERAAHELLLGFCTGRWPLWRLLGLRRSDSTLFIAVRWVRGVQKDCYAVAELALDRRAVCWSYFPSAASARAELKKVESSRSTPVARRRRKVSR